MKLLKTLVVVGSCLLPVVRPLHAKGQSLSSDSISWLQPSDALIQRAVDDGFSGKKLPKDARYHTYRNWIKPGIDAQIEVIPPLFCAEQAGQTAHDKLESKPDLESVKRLCLNSVTVELVHYSQSLGANWPCVFQKGDLTLQPLVKRLDQNPEVAKYYGGFLSGDVVGYRYIDIYAFQFPQTLVDGASLVYADETGQHHTLNYDFSQFVKDVPPTGGQASAQMRVASDAATAPSTTAGPAPVLSEATEKAILANSEAGKSSDAAAASMAESGHVLSPQEMAAEVQSGKASKCAVITNPPGADIYVDGNKAGVSPMVFVLLRKGDSPRTITIKMSGYKTIEKKVLPDGNIIPLGLTLEKEK